MDNKFGTFMQISLAPKEAKEHYSALHKSKEALFNNRYLIASSRKSDDWSTEQIIKVCKSLKNSKATDELGQVYELFKPPYAGTDVYHSLTKCLVKLNTS